MIGNPMAGERNTRPEQNTRPFSEAETSARVGVVLRTGRWRLRRIWAGLRHGQATLENSPILFGNSFPKSGTHLLAQVLQAFPRIGLAVDRGMGPILTFVRSTGRRRTAEEILSDLRQLRPGDVCFGHVIAEPEIRTELHPGPSQGQPKSLVQRKVAHFFMLRDPRDAVVSHAYYLPNKAVHNVHHQYYRSLPSLDDRIRASILGRPELDGLFPTIRERFELYLDWLDCPEVCLLRFEEFITDRRASLANMLDYAVRCGFRLRLPFDQALEVLSTAIDPQRSYTFRSGQVGDWRTHFNQEHVRLFKEVAGDLLIRLGYEKDDDWNDRR